MTRSLTPSELAQLKRIVLKELCEADHLTYTRYFFRARQASRFHVNWHHRLMCSAVQGVIDGETPNLVINVAPGASKTETVVINFISRGLALNPRARFLHLSYSDELATLNSHAARELVASDEYQALWPLKIRDDSRSKKRWNVEVDGKPAGGCYATSLGGQITGFRAGHMEPGWQGAIVVDDPLKVDDAFSKSAIETANRLLLSTVKSRRALPTTPLVLIMQRLDPNDPAGFLLAGGLPGKWHHLNIPALITQEYVDALPEWLKKHVDMSVQDEFGRASYWEYKEPLAELLELESGRQKDKGGNPIGKHVFKSQYMQAPESIAGSLIQREWFVRYRLPPQLDYRIITADTAQKTAEHNDYSVFEEWGLSKCGRYVLLDLVRGKWTAPELIRVARDFWSKCKAKDKLFDMGKLRSMYVEDKSSGTGLIQTLASPPRDQSGATPVRIPVTGIERVKDKLTEWMDGLPSIESGLVMVPEDAPWVHDYVEELCSVNGAMTHAHDDQLDPTCDAIDILGGTKGTLNTWAKLGAAA